MNEEFWYWFEDLPLSILIGETWLFPFVESLHVLGAVFVLGSIVIVDLRLLGWLAVPQPLITILRESIAWTWAAFVLALITGVLMFLTRASGYAYNPAFLWKMLLLLAAGINMLYFHRRLWPAIVKNNTDQSPNDFLPRAYRVSGFLSLSFWLGIMLAGRWIGHIF